VVVDGRAMASFGPGPRGRMDAGLAESSCAGSAGAGQKRGGDVGRKAGLVDVIDNQAFVRGGGFRDPRMGQGFLTPR